MTPKQGMRILALIDLCDVAIKSKGAYGKVIVKMPGGWRGKFTRRLCKKGPHGKIYARTHNCKNILVSFRAPELKTSMEEIFYGRTTGKSGN